jgi:hypothetical protein
VYQSRLSKRWYWTVFSEAYRAGPQRAAGARSTTIKVNDPGSTGGLPLPGAAGAGPNFAETRNTR